MILYSVHSECPVENYFSPSIHSLSQSVTVVTLVGISLHSIEIQLGLSVWLHSHTKRSKNENNLSGNNNKVHISIFFPFRSVPSECLLFSARECETYIFVIRFSASFSMCNTLNWNDINNVSRWWQSIGVVVSCLNALCSTQTQIPNKIVNWFISWFDVDKYYFVSIAFHSSSPPTVHYVTNVLNSIEHFFPSRRRF